jgi:hypothetical protein
VNQRLGEGNIAVLRRLIRASAIVIGVGLVTGCAVTPVKLGAAAIVGNERISIATLGTEVTNLNQAVKQYPDVVTLTPTEQTQSTLTWLIRYQVNDELARQQGITVSTAQAEAALAAAYAEAKASAEQQGLTNVTPTLILAASGIPPDTAAQLGRYEAITAEYLKIANGGTAPTSTSAQTAAEAKFGQAQCQAAKALDIAVNPQFGQLDYTEYAVVSAPSPVTRPQGPFTSPSPIATAPAC